MDIESGVRGSKNESKRFDCINSKQHLTYKINVNRPIVNSKISRNKLHFLITKVTSKSSSSKSFTSKRSKQIYRI